MKAVDLLIAIKTEFEPKNSVHEYYPGLCAVVTELHLNGQISRLDRTFFEKLVDKKDRSQSHGYTLSCQRIPEMNGSYIWYPFAIKPRVEWLDMLIELYSITEEKCTYCMEGYYDIKGICNYCGFDKSFEGSEDDW